MVNGKTRGADWEHAHRKNACPLKLSLLHRHRFAGFYQGVKTWENTADAVMKSVNCKKDRNDIACQTIQVEWHVSPGDTSVQMLQNVQVFMSENGRAPDSSPDSNIFTSMFNDITAHARKKEQGKCLESSKEFELERSCFSRSNILTRFLVLLWSRTWKCNETRLTSHFADGKWDKLASVMISDFITSKHPVFMCSNMFLNGY